MRCHYVFPYNPSYTVQLAKSCSHSFMPPWQGLAAILARFEVTNVEKGLACVPCTSHKKALGT